MAGCVTSNFVKAPALLTVAVVVAACAGNATSVGGESADALRSASGRGANRAVSPPSKAHFNFNTAFAFNTIEDDGNVIHPYAGLYQDSTGALYATLNGQQSVNFGAIVKLTKSSGSYAETVLHAFSGGTDGEHPKGALVATKGTLYGTTSLGGAGCSDSQGCGTVFSLTPSKVGYNGYDYAVSCSFSGYPDGPAQPHAGLVEYKGKYYGTSSNGGSVNMGAIYEFSPSAGCSLLYSFQNGAGDGGTPNGDLIVFQGKLYGTASTGGSSGLGTVFSISPSGGSISVLHSFSGSEGATPEGSLVVDSTGSFYGTTSAGGTNGAGTVFEIAGGEYSDIYNFGASPTDGTDPWSGLTLGKAGVLYGTTQKGGAGQCTDTQGVGCGTVFELTPGASNYSETILYSFNGWTANPSNGAYPYAGLLLGKRGILYGTTENGGTQDGSLCNKGCGVLFEGVPSH
jgi:uncharacterized repeat protein (TIGR03803 family)